MVRDLVILIFHNKLWIARKDLWRDCIAQGFCQPVPFFKLECLVHHFQPAVLTVLFLLFSLVKFEGNSLHQLVLKICRGHFHPVSPNYSYDLRILISQLFNISPKDRPSVNSILRKPFLQNLVLRYLPPEVSAFYCCLLREKMCIKVVQTVLSDTFLLIDSAGRTRWHCDT